MARNKAKHYSDILNMRFVHILEKILVDKTKDLYVRLIKFINDNNLTIIGYSYEEVLIDECATKNPNEYVIKISIHVS